MGGALLRNMLEKVDLREPDTSDYGDEYADNDEGALGEIHEFPGSTKPGISEKKEVTEAQSQPQAPVFNRIKTSKPTSYNNTLGVGDSLRDNIPVILNLNYMGKPERQRVVGLASGLYFGLEEKLELVGESLLLLTPEGIATVTDQKQTPSFLPSRY